MGKILTIAKRDFISYFATPVGYIYMIVFLLVSSGLFITPFFSFPRADMRAFFTILPMVLCVLIPALTMRSWAQERQDNTIELLMTFPMSTFHLVLGKFIAIMAFFILTIMFTFTIPIMLVFLGDPDIGAIISQYIGSLLLGAFFVGFGIFVSGLSRDQVVAFVLALLCCFASYLFGTELIAGYLDSIFHGLGLTLSQTFGLTPHLNSFLKGVLELKDILFFVIWIIIFLLLNITYLRVQYHPGAKIFYMFFMIIVFAIGGVINLLLVDRSIARWDLTEDKVFTVSPVTEKILGNLKSKVIIKLYITSKENMPLGLKDLEYSLTDKIYEMKLSSKGKLDYRVIHMEVENVMNALADDMSENSSDLVIEKKLLEKGIRPFPVQALKKDQATTQMIYSSIGISYLDNPEEVIPVVMPESLGNLEFMIVNSIHKMTLPQKPVVAVFAPENDGSMAPEIAAIYRKLGMGQEDPYHHLEEFLDFNKYDVKRVLITDKSPIPDNSDLLVIIGPGRLNERQLFEINHAMRKGIPAFIAVQKYEWNYRVEEKELLMTMNNKSSNIELILNGCGISVDRDILMDVNHQPVSVSDPTNPLTLFFSSGFPVDLPTHIIITHENMNPESPITKSIPFVLYLWGNALKLDNDKSKEAKLDVETLMTSSSKSWTIKPLPKLNTTDFEPKDSERSKYPIMFKVRGIIPDVFAGQGIPPWSKSAYEEKVDKEELPVELSVKPEPGTVVVMGSSIAFKRSFFSRGNLELFQNIVDSLVLGDDLVRLRGKKIIDKTISIPSREVIVMWKFINLFLVNFLIATAGVIYMITKRRSGEKYFIAENKK